MLLNARKMVFAGMTLAVSCILLILGGVIETSTMFFLAAGAFCIGIVIREFGLKAGAAFLAASLLLGLLIAPNKLYVLTYGLMELYLFLRELLWEIMNRKGDVRRILYTIGKFVIFQPLYLPVVFWMPELIYAGELRWYIYLLMIVAGEILWLVADVAYDVFQRQIWSRVRRQFDWMQD